MLLIYNYTENKLIGQKMNVFVNSKAERTRSDMFRIAINYFFQWDD